MAQQATRMSASAAFATGLMLIGSPAAAQSETKAAAASPDEIVVTAQRRDERLTDVPIAITAIPSNLLTRGGITQTSDLGLVVPGLNFAVQGAFAQPTIRGIGTLVTNPGADANVAIYIDGVYQSSQQGNLFTFNEIEQIEVLKGPQGTLFGRNATGGAITIKTLSPSFDPSAKFSASYGSFDAVRIAGYATGGLSDKLAANISMLFENDKGYVHNTFLNRRQAKVNGKSVRGKLLWKPTDDFSVVLAGNYSDRRDDAPIATRPLNGNSRYLKLHPELAKLYTNDPRQIAADTASNIPVEQWGASLTAKYAPDWGTISSISAYTRTQPRIQGDIDTTPVPFGSLDLYSPSSTFTQEINFASPKYGAFSFIAGGFYYHDNADLGIIARSGVNGPITASLTANVKTEAVAAYAEGTLDIASALHLVVGGRYNTERKQAKGSFFTFPVLDSQRRWNSFTPRASLRYELSPRSSAYFTFSKGFKSGAYNAAELNNTPVNPEKITAYEIGYKQNLPGGYFNLSAFHYDYKDIQVQIQTNVNGALTILLQNAATARVEGFDADLFYRVSKSFDLRAGLAYTHARYRSFPGAVFLTPIPGGGNAQGSGDASGHHMVRAPDFTFSVTPNYRVPLAGGELMGSVTYAYNSGFYWDPQNRVKQEAYSLVNAKISWAPENARYRISLWGSNLTDKTYGLYFNQTGDGDGATYARPRSVGVELEVSL